MSADIEGIRNRDANWTEHETSLPTSAARDRRALLRMLDEARAERDALAQALHSYGEHSDCCRSGEFTREVDADGNAVPYPCTCGFEDALERYPLAAKE